MRKRLRGAVLTWINNTNEGGRPSRQTLANLAFFKYLHDEYGMTLDIYAFDAGAIDGAGSMGQRIQSVSAGNSRGALRLSTSWPRASARDWVSGVGPMALARHRRRRGDGLR